MIDQEEINELRKVNSVSITWDTYNLRVRCDESSTVTESIK